MSKRFITLKEAEKYICEGKMFVDKRDILASSVQDYLRDNNIEIVYKDECLPKCNNNVSKLENKELKDEKKENKEDISLIIEKILRKDFNIEDELKIKQVIKIVSEVLK